MELSRRHNPLNVLALPSRILRGQIESRLAQFHHGHVRLELPNGEIIEHQGVEAGPTAVLEIKNWRMLTRLLFEGEIGLARSYLDNDWSTPDLSAVLDYGLANGDALLGKSGGWRLAHFMNRIGHGRNANTRRGSQRNIAAHYDLGNAFYAHWLDTDLVYSSAIYGSKHDTLETAQQRKLDRVIELLSPAAGETVLEIGCGWGALVDQIARTNANSVKGISLSNEQIAHARARLTASEHGHKATIEHRDYRDVDESFDRIVSIEMFEAVGEKYWPQFFDQIAHCLNRNGSAVLQIITIAESLYTSYRQRPDFIQQYIFPGGMLPTVSRIKEEATRAGLETVHYEAFGQSYARTLDEWQVRFQRTWPEIEQLGFDTRFRRMWDYYLSYCSAGFRHGSIDVGLFKLQPITVRSEKP